MSPLDPLEQTQENLHPVIVAHRAREAAPVATAKWRRAALLTALCGCGLLVWLLLPVTA
jgi:hypothetical protein